MVSFYANNLWIVYIYRATDTMKTTDNISVQRNQFFVLTINSFNNLIWYEFNNLQFTAPWKIWMADFFLSLNKFRQRTQQNPKHFWCDSKMIFRLFFFGAIGTVKTRHSTYQSLLSYLTEFLWFIFL